MIDMEKQLTARITDIQRFSTDDGPGIRTTVFFKGCNLRCAWCHNPETQSAHPQLLFYAHKCTHCGACKTVCKYGLLDCDVCGACVEACLNSARQISGKTYTVDEVFNEIKKDELFYQTSGGGVTFSGGECMLQIDFLQEILQRCKQQGISTAVDTAGAVDFQHFARILPYTDLFLYDIKTANPDIYQQYVGGGFSRVFENLTCLREQGARVWVRIPTIVGVNATTQDMQAINAQIKACGGVEKIQLLPYHGFGEDKYRALGVPVQTFETPSNEQLESLIKQFDFPAIFR